ncbi:AraC family transcriptional regulator [Pedobacter changchengzhani]|uniref:AraC family transcriptional regulator n=1 Tax=Pedobacter changchengzhani TaxID=2529274 RepID=A0A4R5MM23_9SPHI|nr:AraC family transcriptional regulator [Pedobacter changchengzhani]TDG36556.1 AraC family transcriptional regulator [Pedobacter changchengzhani]
MGLIASLPEINEQPTSAFVMHEKSERLIPHHSHNKGQLSFVEGGIAYITITDRTYVVPAKHYFWIPAEMPHTLRIGNSATVLRSLYFQSADDYKNKFYAKLGIYPANELLIQMINHTERWDGKHINALSDGYLFLAALKEVLPTLGNKALPIVLPITDDKRIKQILSYLEQHIDKRHTLSTISAIFHTSERSLSRLFQSSIQMSFLQYLKTIRMVKAIEMILKSSKSIGEIASILGYSSIASFSDSFLEFTNSRPSDLRKNT